jgi:hypothetical protein
MGLFDELMGKLPNPVPEIKPDTPHYEAIGRFVTSYANAEAAVHLLARYLSGLSDEKARIIFGGMRLADLSDIIRHFIKIDDLAPQTQTTIDSCLTQLVLISKRRHSLVHRSTNVLHNRLMVTNVLTTKSLKATEMEFFDLIELADMQADCGSIYIRLDRIFDPERGRALGVAGAINAMRPWLYIPQPPKTPNLKPRAKSAKPTIRPPSSSGKPERQS